jgi:MoxR-like ATPase
MNPPASALSAEAAEAVAADMSRLRDALSTVILGKNETLEQVVVALFAGGNILLNDVPGVGKTTLAKAVATAVRGQFHRVQFTPDLLPADIVGSSVFSPQTGEFSFRPGPVFANVLLADEINRASPRTQSALLEAMSEGQVSIDGTRHPLPAPFLVIATQNPVEFHGTYPLPEAQLDRFMVQIELGYPTADEELAMLFQQQRRHPLDNLAPVLDIAELARMRELVNEVGVEESVGQYIVALVRSTREDGRLRLGNSPRASLMLFRAAQAKALLRGRTFATPDDVRDLAAPVLAHRLVLDRRGHAGEDEKLHVMGEVLERTAVPV